MLKEYDSLGRPYQKWLCSGAAQCTPSAAVYGFILGWQGNRVAQNLDGESFQPLDYGYDEFNRLSSMTDYSTGQQLYGYVYDRYGNRWQQNAVQGGSMSSVSIDPATNRINSAGYVYDAAGNLISDGFNAYGYDAEGNLIQEEANGTAVQFTYNALNQQVRTDYPAGAVETAFNLWGQPASAWSAKDGSLFVGRSYWGSEPVESHSPGQAYFENLNWLGTKRMTTTGTGVVFGTYASLPFGDGASITSGQDDTPFDEFSGLSDWFNGILGSADHAQFREYSNAQGRWLSPDPSSGSYDFSNPQTFNRYSYVRNNPMAFNDPSGLDKGLEQNGLPGAGFLFGPGANEFALLAIPVYGSVQYGVNDVYIGSTAYGNLLGGQGFSDNYMSVPGLGYPYLGNAFELTTNNPQLLDEVPGVPPIRPLVSANAPSNTPAHTAVAGSVALPVAPGIVVDIPFAVIPSTGKICLGFGGGVGSPGVNVGAVYSSQNIESVLSGASVSVAGQAGWWGAQWIHNTSGIAAGNSMGSPGVSLTVSGSVCF